MTKPARGRLCVTTPFTADALPQVTFFSGSIAIPTPSKSAFYNPLQPAGSLVESRLYGNAE